jgi:hypothetical protein
MKGMFSFAKANGYITAKTSEYCPYSPWDRLNVAPTEARDYEDTVMPDHMFYQMACDKNIFPPNNPYSPAYGPFGWDHRCFFQRDAVDLQFDYVEQFFKMYPGKRKFMHMNILAGHNIAEISNKYVDQYLEKLLYKWYSDKNSDVFKNTVINIYSDHGDHMGMPIIFTYSGKQERHWPIFFQILPKTLTDANDKKIHKNLTTNQNRLMSHWDFFFTNKANIDPENKVPIAEYVKKDRGMNIYENKIPKSRTPSNMGVPLLERYCFAPGEEVK